MPAHVTRARALTHTHVTCTPLWGSALLSLCAHVVSTYQPHPALPPSLPPSNSHTLACALGRYNDPTIYFQFHHSGADMMSHVPQATFDSAAASWAIAAYGVATLDSLLPR